MNNMNFDFYETVTRATLECSLSSSILPRRIVDPSQYNQLSYYFSYFPHRLYMILYTVAHNVWESVECAYCAGD